MPSDFYIEALSVENDVKQFAMGSQALQPLKTFIQNQSLDFQSSLIAQTYVIVSIQ